MCLLSFFPSHFPLPFCLRLFLGRVLTHLPDQQQPQTPKQEPKSPPQNPGSGSSSPGQSSPSLQQKHLLDLARTQIKTHHPPLLSARPQNTGHPPHSLLQTKTQYQQAIQQPLQISHTHIQHPGSYSLARLHMLLLTLLSSRSLLPNPKLQLARFHLIILS